MSVRTELAAAVEAGIKVGTSIAEVKRLTGCSSQDAEDALCKFADPVLKPGELTAYRTRFGPLHKSWPAGIAPDLVALWESVTWRRTSMAPMFKPRTRK